MWGESSRVANTKIPYGVIWVRLVPFEPLVPECWLHPATEFRRETRRTQIGFRILFASFSAYSSSSETSSP